MSKGLQDYYNTIGGYSSNLDSMSNFATNYDDGFYQNFADAVKETKEQGQALIEAGGAVEGVYLGFKGVQQGVRAWRGKYGKQKPGDEDGQGDDSNGGDEGSTNPSGEGDEGDDEGGAGADVVTPNQGAAGTELDAPETITQDPLEFQDEPDLGSTGDGDYAWFDRMVENDPAPGGAGGAGADAGAGLDDLASQAPRSFTTTFQNTWTNPAADDDPFQGGMTGGGEEFDDNPVAPDVLRLTQQTVKEAPNLIAPGTDAADGAAGTLGKPGMDLQGMDIYDAGQSTALPGTEVAEGALGGLEDAVGGGIGDAITGAIGEAGVAALGVAAEAVPILGGIAAIGFGLYELFHHSSKPKPPPVPLTTASMKGEVVTPSFDSVTDTPASASAF